MQQKTDAQWSKTFTPYFVTQQHVRIRTWDVTTKEAVVTQIIPHGVHLSVISGADHQIPFADILEVRRVGDAGIVLDPRVTQSIGRITEAMAQGGSLRIETANACIETAQARGLTLVAVTVVDCVHHARMLIPLQEIIHLTSGIDRAVAHRTAGLRGRQSGVEKRMHTPNAFLKRLSAQTGGRTDRTVRAYLHVAKPLGLTLAEMRVTVGDLITRDLVEVDPGFDRLIRLTVAAQERMIAWQERAAPSGAVRH